MSKSNKYLKKIKDLASKNLIEGEDFLKNNALNPNVHVLDSGLQYEVLVEGIGKKPQVKDKVLCHYKGELLNNEIFDSSYARKKPEIFLIKELISGFKQALLLMPVGSKWRLFIPPKLGYGFESLTPTSGGNLTLIFEVELLSVI